MRRALTQIANELGLNMDTLERWIRQGKIPVNKQGYMGIYNELELSRWAEKQRKNIAHSEEQKNFDKNSLNKDYQKENIVTAPVLTSALKKGGVFYNIKGSNKEDVLFAAVGTIPDFIGKDKDEIYRQLIERENLASTGIGKGVAIPHPRNPLAKIGLSEPMIVACFLENAVDFDSIDDKQVSTLFLLFSPTVEVHLNLLSRLSFCLRDNDFMAFLTHKPDRDLLISRINEIENIIDKNI
ncbi:MAG: PTS sugar transporter subunit IIA [Desulfamplus sp.]|nr:PTS sugar transporter subunit IIA [Desulfamplus sp.]